MALTTNEVKLLSMLGIGLGSFVVGLIPGCLVNRGRDVQKKLFLSALLCFGGGVLLATSMLHMLPEIREDLPEYAELVFCCGFLLLYFIDESVHYFSIKREGSAHIHSTSERNTDYRHRNSERNSGCDVEFLSRNPEFEPNVLSSHSNFFQRKKSAYQYGALPSAPSESYLNDEEESFLCHGAHAEPCAKSTTTHIGLALALTLHALLEGLAVGLQKKSEEVFLLIGAIVSHKFVMAFCLGLELAESAGTVCKYILAMLLFSGGSSLGIGLGMLAFNVDTDTGKIVMPILQGLAGGTLLYVTVSEVLPRERARWHNSSKYIAGLTQVFSVAVGFVLIFFLNKYLAIKH